uniref:Centrosomal protein CEP104 Zn finger domain-containing protein n=1 Tax=Acrobeloides nanus TaxID=290746 RepID=A0A914BZ76_9BILA
MKRDRERKEADEAKKKEMERKQQLAKRAKSLNGRPSSKQRNEQSRKNEEFEQKRSSYQMESHPYKPSGFETMDTELGEDPLTSLRTMNNRLRKMAVSSSLDDKQIKSQLCKQACEELSKAEVELEKLQRKRTDLLLRGDTGSAQKITNQMNDIRNRAMHSAYVDLVMDKSQLAAFGIKSKWTPHDGKTSEEETAKPSAPPQTKKKEDDVISVKSLNTRRKERERNAENTKLTSVSSKRPESAAYKRPIKKNTRLFEFDADKNAAAAASGPFALPENQPTECHFCGEFSNDFSRENLLKSHWSENCPCLTKCDYCDIIVETSVLNEHHLTRCEFVGDDLKPCGLCGLASYRGESNHPRCRKSLPPDGGAWCPLCSIAVSSNSKEAWKKHVREDCYNNPRKNKSGVPDARDAGGNEEMMKRDRERKEADEAKKKEMERKQQLAKRAKSLNGRPSSKQRNGKSRKDEEFEQKRSSYQIESHPYKPLGFETMNSKLGEDPITEIRTMKNRLRKMAVSSTLNDSQVKTHLCQQACEELSKAEVELEKLQRKRTDLLLRGDTGPAQQIANQMNDIRNRAMHSAYVDLVMDKSQSATFGVKSKWTQPGEETSDEEIVQPSAPPQAKKKEDDMISVKSLNTRRKERERNAANTKPTSERNVANTKPTSERNAANTKPTSESSKRPESTAYKRPIKKNTRLFGFDAGKNAAAASSPFAIPIPEKSEPTECQFCGEVNNYFSHDNLLKSHWSKNCPCLTKCDYCDMMIETSQLNDHHLVRCKFVGNDLKPCELCGLACYDGRPNHLRCRSGFPTKTQNFVLEIPPPNGGVWCPLCSIEVSPNSKETWQKHARENCYNNPRKNKSGIPNAGNVGGVNNDDFLGSIDKVRL